MKERIEKIKQEIVKSNMDNKYIDDLNAVIKYIETMEGKLKETPEVEIGQEIEAEIPYTVYIEHANIQIGAFGNPPPPHRKLI